MLELLFKQLGIDPKNLKKQVDDAAENFKKIVDHFNMRLDHIDNMQREIIKRLDEQ